MGIRTTFTGWSITRYTIGYLTFLTVVDRFKVSQFFFIDFRKDTRSRVPGLYRGRSVVYHFQLKYAVLVENSAKSAGVKWQEEQFYQYMFMTKANQLMYSI